MSTMQPAKAIVANAPTSPGSINWSLQDIQCASSCGPGEVLVEIVATGLCHTDLFVSSVPERAFGIHYPKVMGHEGAGYIRALGPNPQSNKLQINDPVLLSFPSCTACAQCKQGHPAHCTGIETRYTGQKNFTAPASSTSTNGDKHAHGPSIWGSFLGQSSFARYTVANETSCISLRGLLKQESDLRLFAPLGCSFLTGIGASRNIAKIKVGSDESVLIMGIGGVGMGALLAATYSRPKTIIVLDKHASRLQLARDLGATHALNTREPNFNLLDAVRAICPDGPSVVIDTTGSPALIEHGLQVAAARARVVLVGIPPVGHVVGVEGIEFINSGKSVMGCLVGDTVPETDIPQIIQWYYEGRFPLDRLTTAVPIDDYEKALQEIEAGEIIKAVLVWDEVETRN